MNDYQLRELANAKKMAEELSAFYPSKVIQGDNESLVILTRNDGKTYRVRKDYNNCFIFTEYPYYSPKMVNSDQRRRSQEVFKSNNIKVLTKKKIDVRLNEVDESVQMLKDFEHLNRSKVSEFLADVKKLEKNFAVKYYYKREYYTHKDGSYRQRETKEIMGGEIVKNGVEFDFNIDGDGYISKDLKLHYSVKTSLDNFSALSANNYKDETI